MDCQWPSAATCMVVSSIPADLISPQQWEEINIKIIQGLEILHTLDEWSLISASLSQGW
jgi:hypothetical protein